MIGRSLLAHPASETDRLVQPPGVEYTRRAGYWCVRTPERPDYRSGNLLLIEDGYRPGAMTRWMAWWREELGDSPAAQKVEILWETELEAASSSAQHAQEAAQEAGRIGLSLNRLSVMRLERAGLCAPPRATPLQPRPVRTDGDWAQVLALAVDDLAPDEPAYADFLRWRYAGYRALAERGQGQWWGVWDRALLVGSAGFFGLGPRGRFQEVITRTSHRRQGICARLCHAILDDFFARMPEGEAIIVADEGSQAESIYRRLGFRITHIQWELSGK